MPAYFLDSSAVLKRYVAETGTIWVRALFDPIRANRVAIATITGAEVVAAVARRARGGGITAPDAAQIIGDFRLDFTADFELIEISGTLVDEAMRLAEQHALRGYDAVQLAAALAFHRVAATAALTATLVSADHDLNAAAANEGLVVEDPTAHP